MMIDYTGQQIGSYRLVRRLGTGGFASVYLGQHVRIATQQAAIKLLHLFDVDARKFQQEAETMAALVHPHIIRLFDFDFHDQMPFLVIEYAPGGSLRTRYPEGTQVLLPNVVQYVQQIAEALEYAHGKNVIHRDIKPDNILIGMQGELRLSDFGIAVLSQTGRNSLGASSGVGGTAYYMAPEQSRGKPEKASDQYALAIMVYEWLYGKPPFTEGNAINIQYQHAYEPVPPLSELLPTLPLAIEQVIMRALTKDPKGRFASVKDFAQALKIACSDTAPTSVHSLPPTPSPEVSSEVPPAGNSKKHRSDGGASAASSVGRNASVSHPPVHSRDLARTRTPRRKKRWGGSITVILIFAILLISGSIVISSPALHRFYFGPSPSGNVVLATATNSYTSSTTATITSHSSMGKIVDEASVLNQSQVKSAEASLRYQVDIYTTDTFSGSKSQFLQRARDHLTNSNLIVMAINVNPKFMTVVAGKRVPLSNAEAEQVINSFKQGYQNSGSNFTSATVSALQSLQHALETGSAG